MDKKESPAAAWPAEASRFLQGSIQQQASRSPPAPPPLEEAPGSPAGPPESPPLPPSPPPQGRHILRGFLRRAAPSSSDPLLSDELSPKARGLW
eukprot:CAMPEP_0170607394 /NCGR_PEP_ID=MMETSP0224-20130122/21029_1 /TAXON_ID=285029 /ORGANISM="Togula jolla, Strain CCCM 725" /LENGTH=93 /DNA_ID=CAMNT_0010932553 /DNA_START=415 /DNA_END=697 /DNA_ORIENTATION=+